MGQDKALLKYDRENFLRRLAGEFSKDLSRDLSKGLSKDSSKDLSKNLSKNLSKDLSKDLSRNLSKDLDTASSGRAAITEVFLSVAREGDYKELGLPVVADENQGIGPIEGIRRGLGFAREDYLFVCAVDMPFVQKEMALHLAGFISPDHDAYIFREGGRIHPTCAIYHRSVRIRAEEMIREGRYRLGDLCNGVRVRYVDLEGSPFMERNLQNINTPEDYRMSFPCF